MDETATDEEFADECAEWDAMPLWRRVWLCARDGCWIDALYEIGVPERASVTIGRALSRSSRA